MCCCPACRSTRIVLMLSERREAFCIECGEHWRLRPSSVGRTARARAVLARHPSLSWNGGRVPPSA